MMKQLTQNVFVEPNILACNLGLITTSAGNVLIDSPLLPVDAVKWREEALKMGEVMYLINTEEHPDHFQCCDFLPGTLVSSKATRDFLKANESAELITQRVQSSPESVALMKSCSVRLADITFEESMTIHLGGLMFELMSIPGHSPGGIGVFIPEEKVVFTTDIIFHKAKSWLQVADPEQWLVSLKKIEALPVEHIVPGHGEICTKDYLKEQAQIVQGWIDLVKSAIKRGLTQEQLWDEFKCPDPYPKQPGTPLTEEGLDKANIARLYSIYSK